ncbi:MAG: hypothetical protein A3J38_01095 [Gammaproteobacteria bacterium RIFCSPHIGHO2_12_FULL_45_9]|nr:MAG: hypothetical protein A3J38_01095 [Gammaproteobacteria bacterium RIFCSPHIGHO2_12_FULL_45_9]
MLSERWRWLQGAIHSVDSAQTNDQTNPYWEQCKQKIHDSWYPYRGIKPADDTPTIIQYIWHETIRTVSERSPSFQTSVAHDVFIADAKSEMLAHQIRAIIRPDQRFPLSRQPATVPLQQTERVQTILTAQGPKARFLNFWVAGWSTIAQKLAAHSGTFDLTTSNNTELYTFSLCTIFNNPFTLSLNPQDFHYHEYMQQPTFTLAALNRPFQPITQPASPVSSANTSIDTPPSRKKILSTLFTNFSLHLPRTTPSVSDATQAHPNRHNMTAFFETRKKTHRVAPDALPPAPAPSSP